MRSAYESPIDAMAIVYSASAQHARAGGAGSHTAVGGRGVRRVRVDHK